MTLLNYIDKLPWNTLGRKWAKRSLATIDRFVVHQAASKGATVEAVNKYHITPTSDRDKDGDIEGWEKNHISPQGCPHICYHYAIGIDGTVYQCNPLTDVTWHCKGFNTKAVGILVCGAFKGPGFTTGDEPTDAQKSSLVELLNKLHQDMPQIPKNHYFGHCELDPKGKPACPGTTLLNVLKGWRQT